MLLEASRPTGGTDHIIVQLKTLKPLCTVVLYGSFSKAVGCSVCGGHLSRMNPFGIKTDSRSVA